MKKANHETRKKVASVLTDMGNRCQSADDIHAHTRFLGEQFRLHIHPVVKSHELIQDPLSLKETIEEIQAFSSDKNVQAVLNSINHVGDAIESETGVSPKTLLIEAWKLAQYDPNSQGLIVDNLRHNKVAGGGCLAGIAGRLIHSYTLLANEMLESLSFTADLREALPSSPEPSQETLLFMALQNSKESFQEEEDLRAVLEMSKHIQ